MLGTPPAFVLSQDQTLKKLYLNPFRSLNHFLNNLSSKLLKNFRWLKFDFSSNLNNLQNCPRCFLVRLHVIQFTRYSSLPRVLAVSLFILAQHFQFVKNFFQVPSIFFALPVFFRCPSGQLQYITRRPPDLSRTFCRFFAPFFKKTGGLFQGPHSISFCLIWHHQSTRSRHRFCGKRQQRNRRYPHRGKQRSYDPADSSAAQLLLWSLA